MAQKPERIRTLGCGGLVHLAMELDKGDYEHEPVVILEAADDTIVDGKKKPHVRASLAESTCRKLAAMLLDFADKLAAVQAEVEAKNKGAAKAKAETAAKESPKEAKPAEAK